MKQTSLSLLCNPFNGEPLQLVSERDPNGKTREWLAGASGQRFPIQADIPIFAAEGAVSGANKKYQTLYDRIARGYDISEKIVGDLMWGGQDKVRRAILQDVQIQSGDTVLEVSIGTGINLRYLPADANYFGLDISMGMLRQCQRNLAKWRLQAELVQGTAESLPFKEGVFDVVLHFGGINFFNDKAQAIREMIRVARPGAPIFIGDETEDLARQYEKSPLPFVNQFYHSGDAFTPLGLVPAEMLDVKSARIWQDKFYMLSFRKP